MLIHFQYQYEQVNGLNCSLLRDSKLLVLVAAFLSRKICLFVNSTTVECELAKLSEIERVTTCE